MQDLLIHGSNISPDILLKDDGIFKISGRILTDNAVKTFEPVFAWLSGFNSNKVCFEIRLDYINTSASMQLFAMLKLLDEDLSINEIRVKWFYELDDEDHLETGHFFEAKLSRILFDFIGINNLAA